MSDEAKQIAPSVLLALLKQAQSTKTANGEKTKALADRIGHHVEHSNLHRKAFAIVGQMDRMDEQDRENFWSALGLYVDIVREKKWDGEGHVGDLAKQAEEKATEEAAAVPARDAEEAKASAENVKRLRRGVRQLAEKAGATVSPPPAPDAGPGLGDAPGTYKLQ